MFGNIFDIKETFVNYFSSLKKAPNYFKCDAFKILFR